VRREKAKLAAREGKNYEDGAELFGDWLPHNPRAARLAYELMDATEWQHLPDSGGFMAQDEALMEDIALLSRMAGFVREQLRVNNKET